MENKERTRRAKDGFLYGFRNAYTYDYGCGCVTQRDVQEYTYLTLRESSFERNLAREVGLAALERM